MNNNSVQISGNLEGLMKKVLDQAWRKADSIVERAEKASEREISQLKEETEQRKQNQKQRLEESIKEQKRTTVAQAEQNARRKIMNERENVIQKVFDQAMDELSKINDEAERFRLLVALVKEGIESMDTQSVRVHLNAPEKELIEKQKETFSETIDNVQITVADKPIKTRGGPQVSDESERVIYDNTFEAWLEREQDRLRRVAIEALELDKNDELSASPNIARQEP